MPSRRPPVNYALLFPYSLPYFGYVIALTVLRDPLGTAAAYAVAAALSGAGIAWAWRWTLPLRGSGNTALSVAWGVVAGLAGTAVWIATKAPFVESAGDVWEPAAFWMRLAVSATLVPVFEELLFRGLVLRGASQWWWARQAGSRDPLGETLHERSIDTVAAGRWTGFGLIFSSLVFALGHAPGEWLAASLYGLGMGGLAIWRRDLVTPIVAHAVTNASLALVVRETAMWGVW